MSTQRRGGKQSPRPRKRIRDSQLYRDWYWRAGSGNPNDYIIAISANPRTTGVSGTGKTTLGLSLAKYHLDIKDSPFSAEEQTTLDPFELSEEIYPDTKQGAAIIYDEAQGTGATTGLNSKRAMKEESLNAINTIATRRKDRKTLIVITQNIKSLVTDLYDYIDAWILIQDDIKHYATHYAVQPDVFNFETRKTTTPGIEDLAWRAIPMSDPDYRHLDKLKDEAIEKRPQDEDEDKPLPKEVQAELAVALKEVNGTPWRKVPELSERLTYSGEYLRQAAKEAELA